MKGLSQWITAIGLAVVLSACASSPPTRLYVLEPAVTAGRPVQSVPGPRVAIDRVLLPEHLAHRGIFLHEARFRARRARFDHWAGPLDANILDVLAADLAALAPGIDVTTYPWDAPPGVDYTVRVRVRDFAATPGDEVVLSVVWTITRGRERLPVVRRSVVYQVPRAGDGVLPVVEAMSRALGELARDIADGISRVSHRPAAADTGRNGDGRPAAALGRGSSSAGTRPVRR